MKTRNIFIAIGVCIMTLGSLNAQENTKKTKVKNLGDLTEVTYFHDNGKIAQQGTFNKKGELEGIWTSYDENGVKVMVGEYSNNLKTGNWLIWEGEVLREVEYDRSKIVKVSKWLDKELVAIK